MRRRRLGRAGNVLVLVALVAVPLIGVVALATDFGQTSVVKGKLDLAADEAALLGATAASNAWQAGDANAAATGATAAEARFNAQTGNQSGVAIGTVNAAVTRAGGLFGATVNYTAQVPTSFARVLGITVLPVSGTATASLSLNPYVDIQILMDVSSSMTIAASPADLATMESLTEQFKPSGPVPGNVEPGQACGFACHWSTKGDDYYALAQKNNVQLRITVLQSAVSGVIDTVAGLDTEQRIELGLYSFSQALNTVYPLSDDIQGARSSVAGIVPDINDCSSNCPDTYFANAMAKMTAIDQLLPQQGANVPQRFLFIVTDGVYDDYVGSDREIGPFDPKDCAALKALGVNILVLYTPYLPLLDNAYYVQHVEPISGQIMPDLVACASSPSYFFVANDGAAISAQLQNMVQLVIKTSSHLIQ